MNFLAFLMVPDGWDTGQSYLEPFIKHCTVSAQRGAEGWVLDGINNLGFSGGPVITGKATDMKVIGVISGFLPEPAEVIEVPVVPKTAKLPTSQQPNNSRSRPVR